MRDGRGVEHGRRPPVVLIHIIHLALAHFVHEIGIGARALRRGIGEGLRDRVRRARVITEARGVGGNAIGDGPVILADVHASVAIVIGTVAADRQLAFVRAGAALGRTGRKIAAVALLAQVRFPHAVAAVRKPAIGLAIFGAEHLASAARAAVGIGRALLRRKPVRIHGSGAVLAGIAIFFCIDALVAAHLRKARVAAAVPAVLFARSPSRAIRIRRACSGPTGEGARITTCRDGALLAVIALLVRLAHPIAAETARMVRSAVVIPLDALQGIGAVSEPTTILLDTLTGTGFP